GGGSWGGGAAYPLAVPAGAGRPAPPAAPAALTLKSVSMTQAGLTWADNSQDETGFEIWRKSDSESYARVGTAGPNASRFTDRGLSPGRAYTYEIRAVNAGGASPWSNEVPAVTLPEPPEPPAGLTVTVVSRSQIDLSWTERSRNETGFELFRRSGAGSFVRIGAAEANDVHFSDTGLS